MSATDQFKIQILQNVNRVECLSIPLQIFYVSLGSASMTVRGTVYEMKQEDIILVNGMEPYTLTSGDESLLCEVSIDYSLITSVSRGRAVVFTLNSLDIPRRPYQDIREIFRELVYFEVIEDGGNRCRKMSVLYELLDILFLHCDTGLCSTSAKNPDKLTDDEKLQTIIAFVNSHYSDNFSLRELAGTMYTSASTLSRFFKKHTGFYYAEYMNRVRLAHAVSELESGGKSITRIAMDAGFSSSSAFSRVFHDLYGKSPGEYRKEQSAKDISVRNEREELRKALEKHIGNYPKKNREVSSSTRILAEVKEGAVLQNPWSGVLNMSSLSLLTRANVQSHMLQIARDLHITHVKIWSIFARDLRITDGSTIGSYNYSMVDTVLDVLVENKLAVYLDFGSRPDVIIGTKEDTILSEEVGIRFRSRRAWESLFEDFIRHLVFRYGTDEIERWIFDFCIDPTFRGSGFYYEDPNYDYQNVYEFAYRTLRALVPGARVGGPMAIPNSSGNEIGLFLERCVEDGCLPDFVSIPLLPYQPDMEGNHFVRNPDPEFEARHLKMIRDLILKLCGTEIPIYVSDWNLSISNRNVLNDSCMRGVFLCNKAFEIMKYARLCSVWVASDWISNYYDIRAILSGCGGIVSVDGIRKPVYYALQFLQELQGTVLYSGPNMIVTMKNPGSFRVLCGNLVSFHIGYYLREEEELTAENMDVAVVSDPPLVLHLELSGLEEGAEYAVKTRRVNRHYGSVLDEWKRFDYEQNLTREDIKYLRDICVPHLSLSHVKVADHKLTQEIVLDEQEFRLLHIFRCRS